MFYVSEIHTDAPKSFKTKLQCELYKTLERLEIPYERVETDEAITMEDCKAINEKLHINMVKTLFLCNRQQTEYYLFITKGDKPFSSKRFSTAMGISRVSFAPQSRMEEMLKTKIGAATVFSSLVDDRGEVRIVFDKEIADDEYYACSDSTTTGYMKLKTKDIILKFLPFTKHRAYFAEV